MQFEKIHKNNIENIRNLQPVGWPDIIDAFTFYTANDYCHPITIRDNNTYIGIGNSISFNNTAWLAHIIVDPNFRNKGIGSKIVEHLITDLKNKGIETILLIATELGEPIYKKAGFKTVSDYRYFIRKTQRNECISTKIKKYNDVYYSEIMQLDKLISGEHRENLIKNYLHNAFVFIDDNILTGFYIPNLGEGPIFASTNEAGIELMRLKYSKIEKATIPVENYIGIEFLRKMGFIETETKGMRMILGKDIPWKPHMMYSRIGGNFG